MLGGGLRADRSQLPGGTGLDDVGGGVEGGVPALLGHLGLDPVVGQAQAIGQLDRRLPPQLLQDQLVVGVAATHALRPCTSAINFLRGGYIVYENLLSGFQPHTHFRPCPSAMGLNGNLKGLCVLEGRVCQRGYHAIAQHRAQVSIQQSRAGLVGPTLISA